MSIKFKMYYHVIIGTENDVSVQQSFKAVIVRSTWEVKEGISQGKKMDISPIPGALRMKHVGMFYPSPPKKPQQLRCWYLQGFPLFAFEKEKHGIVLHCKLGFLPKCA